MSRNGRQLARVLPIMLLQPRHSGAIINAQTRSGCVLMIEPGISRLLSMSAQGNVEIPGSRPAALPRNDGGCDTEDRVRRSFMPDITERLSVLHRKEKPTWA